MLRGVGAGLVAAGVGGGRGPGLLVAPQKHLEERGAVIFAVRPPTRHGDSLLAAFRRRGLTADLVSFPAGEGSKSRRVRDEIEDGIIRLGAGRDTALLALGGGVVGDLVGFVAATFKRGVPYLQVPTNLI